MREKVPTTFLLMKLGLGIRVMSENVETPALPKRMGDLLTRLEKVPDGLQRKSDPDC